jgi:putative transposase
LFLRKQLAFYREREVEARRLTDAARVCLLVWSRLCNWREALVVVKPETLIAWHRKGFRLFWKWKSKGGRPRLPRNIRRLIAEMAAENPTWGEERLADELALKLGIYVSPRTVRAYWPEEPLRSGPRSTRPQHWRTFVRNHARAIVACDFLVVVTALSPAALCAGGDGDRLTKDRALQRHAPPNRNLDNAAITGSHPQRPRIQVPDS